MKQSPLHILVVALLVAISRSSASAAPSGDHVLHEMSAKLAAAKTFSFEAQRETDPALLEGRNIPEKSRVSAVVRRPNQFAAKGASKAGSRQIIADGRTLTVLDRKKNHYAQVPMRATLDGLIDKLDAEYGFTPPLLEFASSNIYRDFHEQARSVTYAGTDKLPAGFFGSVSCHHLALKGPAADAELWVGTADLLPRKLVATFHRPGNPQVHVEFFSWNLSPAVSDADFTFHPPAGAQKIEMWTTGRMDQQSRKTNARKH